jgi:catechol 2,3-dioxygenase-like lactoylglutathione lyase family enzyme
VFTGIDHLVIAVREVEAAAAILERDLGLAVTGGGRHEAMGTYNRLAFLGDTYLELIGVFDRRLVLVSGTFAVARATLARLEAAGEGLATYALAVDDAAAEVARLRAAGSPIGEPVPGSRRRPDGEIVRWTCAFPELGPDRPPFLIEHEPAGAEWGPEARATRAAFRHPGGGALRLASLELPVTHAHAVAREYGTVLGIAFSEGWRAAVGPQETVLRPGGGEPVVTLTGEPGTEPLDLVRFGVRWRRVGAAG